MRQRVQCSRCMPRAPVVLVIGCGAGGLGTPVEASGALEGLHLPTGGQVPEALPAIVARVNTHTITSDELGGDDPRRAA